MTGKIEDYLPFYFGCRTNEGELIGISMQTIFIRTVHGTIVQHDVGNPDFSVKPFLKRLNHLSADESSSLIEKGFSIGRPMGYSFSPSSFLYLLSLHVDLFGLIDSGLALDIADLRKDI